MTTSADRYDNPGSSSGMTEMLPIDAPYEFALLRCSPAHWPQLLRRFFGGTIDEDSSRRFVWATLCKHGAWSIFAALVFQALVNRWEETLIV